MITCLKCGQFFFFRARSDESDGRVLLEYNKREGGQAVAYLLPVFEVIFQLDSLLYTRITDHTYNRLAPDLPAHN